MITENLQCGEEAFSAIKNWLDRSGSLRRLEFNPNYTIKYNINTAKRDGYLPISLQKLKIENSYLVQCVGLNLRQINELPYS
jgi:hypothetical protein